MSQEQQKVIWQAESTHPEKAETAQEALRQVIDPEIGLNVVELGLIRDLTLTDEKAHIVMIMTTPFCPYGPALLEMARQKVEGAFLGSFHDGGRRRSGLGFVLENLFVRRSRISECRDPTSRHSFVLPSNA
jgi:metal-sulfur cluster biosynthetic enzyme